MRVSLDRVTKGRRDEALPETSLAFSSGTVTLAVAETEQRPTVLGLLASGRMRPDSGTVTLDGDADSRGIRRRVALVDAPGVSEPAPNVSVAGLVGEELMFAGRRADPFAARAWLADRGLRDLASTPLADVSPEDRLRMLCELALLRPGVDGLVVVAPDRHGGAPLVWWRLLHDYADRGAAVLVIAGRASEWAIEHQTAIDDIAAGEAFATEALGEVSERQAAFAQSGGASLTGAEPDPQSDPEPAPESTPDHDHEPTSRPQSTPEDGSDREPEPTPDPEAAPAPDTTRTTDDAPDTTDEENRS